ncbi:MAG: AAA family ATPase [Bacilli bacterium]|jgi:putative ATPase|nr:AAA family ATPase [Bacilli bacterium]
MSKLLADMIRPKSLDDIVGQSHLVNEDGIIKKMIDKKELMSMILFGPAGIGKTTLARIIVSNFNSDYREINATNSNKKDLEEAIMLAKMVDNFILIVDEIHRLNKDKQDILLPHIESGLITLIGLTNANPYHSINPAIRSRCILLELKAINDDDMKVFVSKVIAQTPLLMYKDLDKVVNAIVNYSNKDVRYAINLVQLLSINYEDNISIEDLLAPIKSNIAIDKNSSYYYDVISALQKSIRGSDVNAALIYLAILVCAEDLEIIERRLSVIAYEDIGLANPEAVNRTLNALQVARMVGFPEARIPLAFATIDLALSSKSNKAKEALDEAISIVENKSFSINDYLQATPIDSNAKKAYWSIPYDMRHLIQYLPDEIKDLKLYHPKRKSSYEKQLALYNDYLNEIERTNDIKSLLSKVKK